MADETWVLDDDDRYSRLRLIAWWDQDRLASAKVMVVGAGALGNEVLKNLALLGVGHIHVIDFDHIENSNLARSVLFRQADQGHPKAEAAARAVRDLNPHVNVRASHANVLTDLGLGEFLEADVVIGCLDNREARLWVNRCCWKVGTPWIDGGIQEINGVVKTYQPPEGACYECTMTRNDYQLINLRYSCPLLRQEDLQAGKVPTAPTIASIIGGLQTQEALKLLHSLPVAHGEAMVFNGVANQFYRTRFQRKEDCLSHETYAGVTSLPLSAAQATTNDLLSAASEHLGDCGQLTLQLDRDLVQDIVCEACGHRREIMRPAPLVGAANAICRCGELAQPNLSHEIPAQSPLASRTLAEVGVPPFDIVRVVGSTGKTGYFLLEADRPAH